MSWFEEASEDEGEFVLRASDGAVLINQIRLKVQAIARSTTIEITFTSADPELARARQTPSPGSHIENMSTLRRGQQSNPRSGVLGAVPSNCSSRVKVSERAVEEARAANAPRRRARYPAAWRGEMRKGERSGCFDANCRGSPGQAKRGGGSSGAPIWHRWGIGARPVLVSSTGCGKWRLKPVQKRYQPRSIGGQLTPKTRRRRKSTSHLAPGRVRGPVAHEQASVRMLTETKQGRHAGSSLTASSRADYDRLRPGTSDLEGA